MKKILKSFTSKKVVYGTFSMVTALVVVTLIVVFNLIMSQLNISYDLTKDKVYTLTNRTKSIIKNVAEQDKEVTIYPLIRTGSDPTLYNQKYNLRSFIELYANISPSVRVVFKDPNINPAFVKKYGDNITENSIIVVCGDRYKVLDAAELYSTTFNTQTWQDEFYSFDCEPKLTNAIRFVTNDVTYKYYVPRGHGEVELDSSIVELFNLSGYELIDIDLVTTDIPEDCNGLFVLMPEARDWSDAEAEKALEYLERDGTAVFFAEYTQNATPVFQSVLSNYGAKLQNFYIIENDSNHSVNVGDNYSYIYYVPEYSSHSINDLFKSTNGVMVIPRGRAIEVMSEKRSTVEIQSLLQTSSKSFSRSDTNSQVKETDSISGPFQLALAITDSIYVMPTQYLTKIVVIGSERVLDKDVNNYSRGANMDFTLSAMSWLNDSDDYITINAKMPGAESLLIKQSSANIVRLFTIGAMPLILLICGVIVWYWRRYS